MSAEAGGGIIKIPLRNRRGEIVAHAVIDGHDAAQANHRWHLSGDGYVKRRVGELKVSLHREVLGLVPGDGIQCDHKDRDRLNCRRGNLRTATYALNRQNLGSYLGSTSAHRGVSWNTQNNKWVAQAKLDGHNHHLGYFNREGDAAAAASSFRAEHMPFSAEALAVS